MLIKQRTTRLLRLAGSLIFRSYLIIIYLYIIHYYHQCVAQKTDNINGVSFYHISQPSVIIQIIVGYDACALYIIQKYLQQHIVLKSHTNN